LPIYRAARPSRAACLARGRAAAFGGRSIGARPLDARSLRRRLCAAGFWRCRDRAAARRGTVARRAAACDQDRRCRDRAALWRAARGRAAGRPCRLARRCSTGRCRGRGDRSSAWGCLSDGHFLARHGRAESPLCLDKALKLNKDRRLQEPAASTGALVGGEVPLRPMNRFFASLAAVSSVISVPFALSPPASAEALPHVVIATV